MNEPPAIAGPFPGRPQNLKHELRTPLNHIIGYCEMLMEEAQDAREDEIIRDLERIHLAGRQLLSVINDLFDTDKAAPYHADPTLLDHEVRTPLNQIIGYTELLQEEAGPRQSAAFVDDLGKIQAAGRLLLDRVVKHLGVDWLVPLHAVDSTPSFYPDPPASRKTTIASLPGVVLVVDDDAGNREVLQRRLMRMGHTVHLAENGRRALDMMQREAFDLILLDLQMPELNGYQVLEHMKEDERSREIPVIVLSASDEPSRIASCIEMGATDYLAKPFEPVLLRARIDACVEKKRLRDRERAAHQALERQQQHLANELAKAANYVRSILPAPLSGRVESEWCFEPSEDLGGDGFGHHWIDDDCLAIYLLDVCGHGVGAALLSVSVLNALRAQTLGSGDLRDPAAVLSALNRAFPAEAQNFVYFTMWYGVFRLSTRELRYSSGGHPPALLLDSGRIVELSTGGAAIGCFSTTRYQSESCVVPEGARLLVFSDGVFEIFLEGERVQTFGEFVADLQDAKVFAMSATERLLHARQICHGQVLEDDFSLLQLRFP